MDILVRGIPVQTTESALKTFFKPILEEFAIIVFNCKKTKNKPIAILTIADSAKAELFLKKYNSQSQSLVDFEPLLFINKPLKCTSAAYKPDEIILKALRYEEEELLRKATRKARRQPDPENPPDQPLIVLKRPRLQKAFDFSSLWCGVWDYNGSQAAFAPHFQDTRRGTVMFGKRTLAMVLRADGWVPSTCRIDIPYWSIDTVVTCSQLNKVTFTLKFAPRVYKLEDGLEGLMSGLGISAPSSRRNQRFNRTRVSAIDESHELVVGSCFVYQITLANPADVAKLDYLVRKNPGMPPALSLPTSYTQAHVTFRQDFERLKDLLYAEGQFGNLKFSVKFQVERLARNAYLPPAKVVALLPTIKRLSGQLGYIRTANAIRALSRNIQYPGPHLPPEDFNVDLLARALAKNASGFKIEGSIYDVKKRHKHIALIHRVIITPAGTYLEGPEPEVSNRVLRKYPDHTDNFLRVQFVDEDGDAIRYEPKTSLGEIFHNRFKYVLDSEINIGGHSFAFLGFSHSSLRSQTCWFMAPFVQKLSLIAAQEVIKGLGDFSKIRSPAKCAARIGQAFSDTSGTVTVNEKIIKMIPDVINERQHIFSDGVGKISYRLLKRVWKEYQQAHGQRPTCLQIRFGGAKGMVSLDDRLTGEQLVLRPSMVKFHGAGTWNIEICGANFKPLPMYLNRQFIKILEDLGVPDQVFLDLQNGMVERLRRITQSPINAATFLEHARVGQATRMPYLLRMLEELNLSFNEDDFLSHVVEIAALSQLRDIKHRARLWVEKAVTLYGIMDETGFLGEDEIYCVIERMGDNGRLKRTVLSGGEVVVTRSPAMHPGDVQKARAVDVPPDSPLQALSNVIVFSSKGERDLPSQLSGGDLDGDLYNIIFDKRLMPRVTYEAADYKKVPPLDIGRPVTRQDITDFFIKFMETDQLGRISNIHLQLADRRPNGTLDPDCLKLAEMASTAVDFSKTGIPVDMSQCPRVDMIRPDFMASGPRVIVEKKGAVFQDDDEDDLLDEDDAVGALDPDYKTFRYYESERVLGQLYRAIDEKKIFQEMQRYATETKSALGGLNLMEQVWAYVLRETALIQWDDYQPLARNIREIYESNLLDIMSDYSTHSQYPLSELEVFGGNIIGKSTGAQNRRTRERTMEMNQRFERDVAFTVERITQGDDGDRDEALARAIACFAVGMKEPRKVSKRVGELRSWKYVAAAVCLREIELFKIRFDPLNRI
ncbi:RNA-dependent RNA polymerase eukaryotic-type [Botryosphaeria dothidea]|uniref:RNA-dependent RNA polymerase n=1 Tax=Botryosphaeria dothidea TaxID=55169 RepID=A0A8H4IS04_9PEZI|nr:RNA-dependent RNA polymerase eukaryotic-type [Botryosphaeria dothidea]